MMNTFLFDKDDIFLVANHQEWLATNTYQLKKIINVKAGEYIWYQNQFCLVNEIEEKKDSDESFLTTHIICGTEDDQFYPFREPIVEDDYMMIKETAIAMAAIYSGAIRDDLTTTIKVQHSDSEILKLIEKVCRRYPAVEVNLDQKNHLITISDLDQNTYFRMAQEHGSVAWMDSKQPISNYQVQWETYWSNLFNPEYQGNRVIQTDDYMAAILYNWSRILNYEFHYHRIKKDQVLVSQFPIEVPKTI